MQPATASAAVVVPGDWAAPLRLARPAVVGRVQREQLLLDLVAVPPEQDDLLVDAVRRVAERPDGAA